MFHLFIILFCSFILFLDVFSLRFNTQPVEQTYVENILRVNVGKKGTFYFSYTGSKTWNDKIYTGTLQQAGRDHFIIVTDTGKTVMLLLVYLLWAEFDEPLDYQYKVK